ncbi:hypothetical protein Drose_37395 [Dactylosporangium roseum]|uniref:DUF5666 domain-containing protein n=1 Tax=Dactylosporangium roseum TaxID=47989 RepID=A0ABY5Z8A6_9ACTN|nr:hypothetical protein [Dactylosporangium roseum]UWZ36614.1 hypothetical protein Drose_37395 [Dactylosporangium roseum]
MGMRTLGLLLAATAVLAGCAARSSGGADTAAPAASASGTAAASAPASAGTPAASPRSVRPLPTVSLPSGLPKTTDPEPPTDDFPQVTAQGRIRVEGQCVNLVTDSVTWTLLGPDAAKLRDGQQVKVVGVPHPEARTVCTGSPLTPQTVTSV